MEQIQKQEGYILVAVCTGDVDKTNRSLDELAELLETAGGNCLGRVIQNLNMPITGTYIGSGKIEEVKDLVEEMGADGILCDDELSVAQLRNLTSQMECKVIDRPLLILDIFAAHASSSEGKLQVEIAQLQYRKSRLGGYGTSLSRLGGGIGTRGPGEKKLEVDRRRIEDRITYLRRELKEVEKHRELIRKRRLASSRLTVALVGYTNAGKSSIFNLLTNANVLAQNKLFATLDATNRTWQMGDKEVIILTDTVGFIQKLPHQLVESFKSTLEEACYADILLHVVDVSNPNWEHQMKVVYETLEELNLTAKPTITIFNKQDKLEERVVCKDPKGNIGIPFSAKTKEGLEVLEEYLSIQIQSMQTYIEKLYTYQQMGEIELIRKQGKIVEERYESDGIYIRGYIRKKES